jgi:hypothetical protein
MGEIAGSAWYGLSKYPWLANGAMREELDSGFKFFVMRANPPSDSRLVICRPGLRCQVRAGLLDRSHQIACLQMVHVSGAALQGPAHQQRLAADVDAGQQAVRAQR